MANLTKDQITSVKGQGFLLNRGTQVFSGRIVPAGCVFSGEDLIHVGELAQKYGSGKVAFTTRLAAEIVGIPYENIPLIQAEAATFNLYFGGTGAKIRPITACKGTTCVYGNFDTQGMALQLHNDFYLGWRDVKLPHKFKIAIGGCPNSCMKPSLNDFGIEGHKCTHYDPNLCRGCKVCNIEKNCPSKAAKLVDGKMVIDETRCKSCGMCIGKCPFKAIPHQSETLYQIYVGGTWGKTTRIGTPLSRLVTAQEVSPLLEKTMLWFLENAQGKERLGNVVERVGAVALEEALFSDDILSRKDTLLAPKSSI